MARKRRGAPFAATLELDGGFTVAGQLSSMAATSLGRRLAVLIAAVVHAGRRHRRRGPAGTFDATARLAPTSPCCNPPERGVDVHGHEARAMARTSGAEEASVMLASAAWLRAALPDAHALRDDAAEAEGGSRRPSWRYHAVVSQPARHATSLRSTPEGAVGSSMTDSCAASSPAPIILMAALKALFYAARA